MLRNKRTLIVLVLVMAALIIPTTVLANKRIYRAKLSPNNELHQVVDSSVHGAANLAASPNGLRVFMRVAGLSGDVTGAHLHGPADGTQNAPVLISLCGSPQPAVFATCDVVNGELMLDDVIGSSLLAQWGITGHDLMDMLDSGMVYVNVHTVQNPAGEARGQLIPFNP